MPSPYKKTYFLLSVADVKQLPPDEGIEVAIVGRSNSGKSSTLNAITQQKALARVSKTPGRTQMINMFVIDEKRRIADLPGYGFAKVPRAAQQKWQKLVNTYLATRQCLRGLVLVMDIRHPLKDLDLDLINYCVDNALPLHILLNKCDKFSHRTRLESLKKVQSALTKFGNSVTLQCYSAVKKIGVEELQRLLNTWYLFSKLKDE